MFDKERSGPIFVGYGGVILPAPTPSPDKRFTFPRADYYVDSDGIRQIPNAASHFLDGSMVRAHHMVQATAQLLCSVQCALCVLLLLSPMLAVAWIARLSRSLVVHRCAHKAACLPAACASRRPLIYVLQRRLWANHGKVVCCM